MEGSIRFYKGAGGAVIRWRHYGAAGARGTVVYLHGIQSHGGWYTGSCQYLAETGFEVAFLDRRGSGLNTDARGDTPNWQVLIEDVAIFIRSMHDEHPGRPVHLVGLSWGGKLAACYASTYPDSIKSLVLMYPGIRPKVGFSWQEKMRVALMAVLRPSARVPVPIPNVSLFTDDPGWIAFIEKDPQMLRECTARFYRASRDLDRCLARSIGRLTVPVLLLLAAQDRIIDNEKTLEFFSHIPSDERQVKTYESAAHTLEYSSAAEEVFRDLVEWLLRHS